MLWPTASCTTLLSQKPLGHHALQSESDAGDDDVQMAQVMLGPPSASATPTQVASPQELAQANAFWAQGQKAWHRGDYAAAEQDFKQALVLQPFLAPAHLALGKIYLLRGVAANDVKRLSKGRRLVEMALKLDPHLADAAALLALFP